MKRWRRKKTIGETNRWGGVSEKKDTAVSQQTHLSRSFCVVSSGTHPHSRYIPGKGKRLNAIVICSLPLSPSPSPATPLNTEYLSTKTKGQHESFELHRHTSLLWVRMSRPAIPVQSAVVNLSFQCAEQTNVPGRADSPHANSEDQVKYQTWSKTTDVTRMEELWQ